MLGLLLAAAFAVVVYLGLSTAALQISGWLAGVRDIGIGRSILASVTLAVATGALLFLSTTLLVPEGIVLGLVLSALASIVVLRDFLGIGFRRASLLWGLHAVGTVVMVAIVTAAFAIGFVCAIR